MPVKASRFESGWGHQTIMTQEKYWEEALSDAFDGCNATHIWGMLSEEQKNDIAKSIRISEECKSLAFYTPPPSDRLNEIEREHKRKIKELEDRLEEQREGFTKALGKTLKLEHTKLYLNKDGGIDYTNGRTYEVLR